MSLRKKPKVSVGMVEEFDAICYRRDASQFFVARELCRRGCGAVVMC